MILFNLFIRDQFNFYKILILKIFILINCLNLIRSQFNPIELGICSDYLTENLISTSVATFKQLWFTSDKISELNKNKLTFITYLDNWLRKDGSPNQEVQLQEIECKDFTKLGRLCQYEIEFLKIKHTIFDGIYMYIFLIHLNQLNWRVIVIELESGKLIMYDRLSSCSKRKNRKYYEKFYCILNQNLDLNSIQSFLMMNIDLKVNLDKSSFEIWCFFKNKTMKKIRFEDREGNFNFLKLSLNSNIEISVSSIQFIPNQFLTFNSSLNPLNRNTRSLINNSKNLQLIKNTFSLNNLLINSSSPSSSNSLIKSLNRIKRENYYNIYYPSSNQNRPLKNKKFRKRKKKKYRKKKKNPNYINNLNLNRFNLDDNKNLIRKTDLNKKSINLHLSKLVNGLSDYLNSFNLTLDTVLNLLKTIKTNAINSLFPYKQNEVIIFHKYYVTFHLVESNYFIQSNRLPIIQPNQIYLGCPQPFCFLSTFDDIAFDHLKNELLIFRNQFYWRISMNGRIKDKNRPYFQINYPKISDAKFITKDLEPSNKKVDDLNFPIEFPSYIDAATFINFENFNYLIVIKDSWVYVYIPNNKRLVPYLLSDYFDERMPINRIDTVFFYGKQLFVFSDSNYWLYDLVNELKLKFNNKGRVLKNLPINLDAAFSFQNRFYFFKQNFFYLNDARGNSLITPQFLQSSFLVGCDKNKLPLEIKMNELFPIFQLINFYCMRCSGYIFDRLKDKWNINNNTFETVKPDDSVEGRENIDKNKIINNNLKTTSKPIVSDTGLIQIIPPPPIISPIDRNDRPIPPKITINLNDKSTTILIDNESNKTFGFKKAMNKIDEFALNSWTFFTHHILFGLFLLFTFFFLIYLCQRNREKYFPVNYLDDSQISRKGKLRRKEMRRRNRRWS